MKPNERDGLLDALLEGEITEADFLRLEAELSLDPAARRAYYERLTLSAMLESEAAAAPVNVIAMPAPAAPRWRIPAAVAAALVVAGGAVALLRKPEPNQTPALAVEQKASGYAVLTGQAGAVWKAPVSLPDGALLPAGMLELVAGVVQIELFSGVTVVAEGGAAFEIVSPMEMAVTRGKVRARVPEPAHGFRIRTAEGDVVDLGTEFAMNVSASGSELHVLDGEVEWHPKDHDMQRMEKGEALRWSADGQGTALAATDEDFVSVTALREQLRTAREARLTEWSQWSEAMKQDPRLLVSYQMSTADSWSRHLPNESAAGAGIVREGAVVAAARADDRWGRPGGALDFSPAGSRVRVSVPGEYRSLTLLCWVKINSLDRWYNSLFLTDGHELHEPHWQIRDDGRLFFSVKKRDVKPGDPAGSDKHIFYSPPFWKASLSGQWLMLATVYDVDARQVTHYLNGEPMSQEPVPAEYLVESVRMGSASLGNWGMPERDDPDFAVRNLNGSMDEFALFSAALSPAEITELYRHGKP